MIGYDLAKRQAGVTKPPATSTTRQGQRLGKNGKPICFTFKVPAGSYTDWVGVPEDPHEQPQAAGHQGRQADADRRAT